MRACGDELSVLNNFVRDYSTSFQLEQAVAVALINIDSPSVADARQGVRDVLVNDLNVSPKLAERVFFAVPYLESWLLADRSLLKRLRRPRGSKEDRMVLAALNRLQFPEEIPRPKEFLQEVFQGVDIERVSITIAKEMSISIAMAVAPSLRDFLYGVGNLIDDKKYRGFPEAFHGLGPRLLSSLMKEVSPSSKIVFRTLDGHSYTASELAEAITKNSSVGIEYASELLRVARDFLAREARRKL